MAFSHCVQNSQQQAVMVIVLLKKVIYSNMQIFKNFPWHIQVYIVLTGTLFTGWLSCIQRSVENIHVIFLTYQQQTHHTFHWIQIFYNNFHSNQLQLNQQNNKKMYYVLCTQTPNLAIVLFSDKLIFVFLGCTKCYGWTKKLAWRIN